MPRNSPAIIELTSRNPYERKTRKEPVGMNAAMTRHRMIRMPTDRRGDRALMLAAADFCAVSLRYPLLAFRPFDGKSRGLNTLCSVPKASYALSPGTVVKHLLAWAGLALLGLSWLPGDALGTGGDG
jgi:hypothetical protein